MSSTERRQSSVVRIGSHVEQYVSFRRVGVSVRNQLFAHRDDFADVRGGARLDVGDIGAERGHVLAECRRVAIRDRGDRRARREGGCIDLVVDVGDVARVHDVFSTMNPP